MLGRLLGVGPDAGIGLVLRLWRWALELSPDGDFSGGQHDPRSLAAAIGWAPEEAPKLVRELVLVGLVEMPVGAGFARIRGLGRYTRAWEKNNRRKPALSPPVTGRNPAELTPEPARKTETEREEASVEQARPVGSKEAREVFAHWQTVMAKPGSKFIGKRLAAVTKRLGDGYSVSDLKAAIDHRAKHAFVNDKGVVFNDLELICRDATQVERAATGPPVKAAAPQMTLNPYPEEFR